MNYTDPLRIEYYINDLPIQDAKHTFDFQHIKSIADHYLNRLKPFSEKINEGGGYVKLNISNRTDGQNGLHFDIRVLGISEELNSEINDSEVFK